MLKPQQQRFLDAYLMDPERNATRAAIAAGYSEHTAAVQASRLLKNVNIMAQVERVRAATVEKLELSVASISAKLLSIAEAAEEMESAPGLSVARQAIMDVAKLNGLVVDTQETITRSPEELAARLAALRAERERIASVH